MRVTRLRVVSSLVPSAALSDLAGAAACGCALLFGNPSFGVNQMPVPVAPGNLDGDGVVGLSDLPIRLANWGPCDDRARLDPDPWVTK